MKLSKLLTITIYLAMATFFSGALLLYMVGGSLYLIFFNIVVALVMVALSLVKRDALRASLALLVSSFLAGRVSRSIAGASLEPSPMALEHIPLMSLLVFLMVISLIETVNNLKDRFTPS